MLLVGCVSAPKDCEIYPRQCSEYRQCRAEQGSKEYQFRVGMEHFVIGDYSRARNWLSKSSGDRVIYNREELSLGTSSIGNAEYRANRQVSEEGNQAANFMMARLYEEGLGVGQDTARAEDYLRRSEGNQVEIKETNDRYTVTIYAPSTLSPDRRLFELYSFEITR